MYKKIFLQMDIIRNGNEPYGKLDCFHKIAYLSDKIFGR